MTRSTNLITALAASLIATFLACVGEIEATPPVGFVASTILKGRFGGADFATRSLIPNSPVNDQRAKLWLSEQQLTAPADLYVQSNVWQPGGSTGWHTHPGRSFIIVTAGTITEYQSLDPACKPHVYGKGATFVDPHGDPAHIVRNEGDALAQTFAVQLIPVGAARRIEVEDPGNCRFNKANIGTGGHRPPRGAD